MFILAPGRGDAAHLLLFFFCKLVLWSFYDYILLPCFWYANKITLQTYWVGRYFFQVEPLGRLLTTFYVAQRLLLLIIQSEQDTSRKQYPRVSLTTNGRGLRVKIYNCTCCACVLVCSYTRVCLKNLLRSTQACQCVWIQNSFTTLVSFLQSEKVGVKNINHFSVQ